MIARLDGWVADLQERGANGRGVPPHALRQRCARHVALWQRLGEWLAAGMRAAAQSLRLGNEPSLNGNGSVGQFDRPDRDFARNA